jgi:hypothetical protein
MPSNEPEGLDKYLAQPTTQVAAQPNDYREPPGLDEFLAPEIRKEKYGTTSEKLKTGLEAAAAAATFGLSTGLERIAGVRAKDIQGRREENPMSYGVGQVAGLVGSSMLIPGGGAAGLIERAGVAAAEKVAAQTALSRIAAKTVKEGIEAAIFQGGDEVSKMLAGNEGYSNPSEAVGTAISNIGLSALLGGAIGGVTGGVSEGAKKLWGISKGKVLNSSLESAAANVDTPPPPPGSPGSQLGELKDALATKTQNAVEDRASAARLGIELPEPAFTESETVRNLSQHLSERPTLAGLSIQKEYKNAFDGMTKEAQDLLKYRSDLSEAQVGKKIKEGLNDALAQELKPIEASYEALKPRMQQMEVTAAQKSAGLLPLVEHPSLKFSKEARSALKDFTEGLEQVKNLNDLKEFRTILNNKITKEFAGGAGGGESGQLLLAMKSELNNMREQVIAHAAELSGMPEGAKIAAETIEQLKSTDKAYKTYKDKLSSIGVETGTGKINSARAMLERFGKLSDESFSKKILDPNDINQMMFFKEKFPELFELARRFKQGEIYENSISEAMGKRGKFEIGKFLSQISEKKMNPEALEMLFPGMGQKIQDLRNVYRAIPGVANPSGTAKAIALGHLFSAQGVLDNLSDAAKYAFLKSMPALEEAIANAGGSEGAKLAAIKFMANTEKGVNPSGFAQMVSYFDKVIKAENTLGKATKAIFDAGETVLPSHLIPSDKDINKLDERLKELQANNEGLLNVGDQVGHYIPDHGMAVSQIAAQSVEYLNSLRPDETPKNPLDDKPVVNAAQKAEFHRALEIAEQPLVILDSIKKGTLTSKDLKHLSILNPGFLSRTQAKLSDHMIEHLGKKGKIPYKTRMGLSLFMGQPLDSTMTPTSIQAAQPKHPAPQPPPMQGTAKSKGSMKALTKMPQASQTSLQARQASSQRQ